MTKNVLAIIGAGEMACSFADKARELGVKTHCFAWEAGAIAKDHVDVFHPISIFEKDTIVDICRHVGVQGVVSTTELTIEVCAYVQEKLGLPANVDYQISRNITNKGWVRNQAKEMRYLRQPRFLRAHNVSELLIWRDFPAIIKPTSEGGKRGVIVVNDASELEEAIRYALSFDKHARGVMIEQYLSGGQEYSVESLSHCGKHMVIQVTEKISSGPPHCVELGHHQPAKLQESEKQMVKSAVVELLNAVSFQNGIAHTEVMIIDDEVYLIELNARPGGDYIANTLTYLSTGYDYLGEAIRVALGQEPNAEPKKSLCCAGVYFVTKQTEQLKPIFDSCENQKWLYKMHKESDELRELENNDCANQNYMVYCADERIELI